MQAVAALGFDPVACPLLRIGSRMPSLPDAAGLQAILLTSGQAVGPLAMAAGLDNRLWELPLLAVGDLTAARARKAGFTRSFSAAGDAADLAALVRTSQPPGAALLLATGAGQGGVLVRDLRRSGYRLHRRVVYSARPVSRLPMPGLAALKAGGIVAALFFSAETARNFVRLYPVALRSMLGNVRALALSPAVAEALSGLPWRSIEVAGHPDAAALLGLLGRA